MPKKQSFHYKHLKEKWLNHHKSLQEKIWDKHKDVLNWFADNSRQIAVGGVGSLMLLATPASVLASGSNFLDRGEIARSIDKSVFLSYDLSGVLPDNVRPLTRSEEDVISQTLTRHFGFRVTPELDGKRLNRSYGYIGAEQHLTRFPGDNMNTHFDSEEDTEKYWSSGMAPGRGAWGYFTQSQEQLTDKDKLREKYYIAVQTFLSEDFNSRFAEYRDFYKYRKMLVVNARTGVAIVVDIADSGPAEWTGKHLGGSPEVMKYLGRVDGAQRGPVLYFFIDDPNDTIPLGPVLPK